MVPPARVAPPAAAAPARTSAMGLRRRLASTPARVRLAVYLAFVAVAVVALLQGWAAAQFESQREHDADLLDRIGALRTEVVRLAHRGALVLAQPELRTAHLRALGALVEDGARTVRIVDALLEGQLALAAAEAGAGERSLRVALERWRTAQGRLREGAASMLRATRSEGDLDPDLAGLNRLLQRDADPALAAAQALQDTVHAFVVARALRARQGAWLQATLTLVLLLFLALAIVEPMVRRLRRRVDSLRGRVGELRRLALVAEHTSALVVVTDRRDRIRWVNAGFTLLVGWRLDEVRYALPGELLQHPQADAPTTARLREAVALGRGLRIEVLCRRRDGSDIWLDFDLRPLRNSAGRLKGFVYVGSDVSRRVTEQAKLRLLWQALPAGVLVQSASGELADANDAAPALLGLTRGQLFGVEPVDPAWRIVREDGSPYPEDEQPASRTRTNGVPLRNETMGVRPPAAAPRWLSVNTQAQLDGRGQVCAVISCLTDITERRALEQRSLANARTDALTGLANHEGLSLRLQGTMAHARAHPGYGFALLVLDFGRDFELAEGLAPGAAQSLRSQVAARLRRAVRPGDAVAQLEDEHGLTARLEGDAFVALLEGVADAARLAPVVARLLAEMAAPYPVAEHPVQATPSIGSVIFAGGEEAAEDLLRDAGVARAEARRAGRGRHVEYDGSTPQREARAAALRADLRSALAEGQFFVVYQPVFELPGRALAGVEALLRWRHPLRGLVPPADFMAVAEEAGLMIAIDAFVLGEACAQFMQWRRELGADAPGTLAVNVSKSRLAQATFVAEVERLLDQLGMPPGALELDVTEEAAGANDEGVRLGLHALRRLGVRVALDDFGAGRSSLASLQRLPVDAVKINRLTVRLAAAEAEADSPLRERVGATGRVAHTLGLGTVAKGIETDAQAELMQRLACQQGQGWLLARPMQGAELTRWRREQATAAAAG